MGGSQMNRRDFQRLTAAALGGVVAGSMMVRHAVAADDTGKSLLEEPHVLLRTEHVQGEKRLRRDKRQERTCRPRRLRHGRKT